MPNLYIEKTKDHKMKAIFLSYIVKKIISYCKYRGNLSVIKII